MIEIIIYRFREYSINYQVHSALNNLGNSHFLPFSTETIDPINLISEDSILLAPLYQIPFGKEEDDWILTSVLPREKNGLIIHSENWEENQPFWIKTNTPIYAPWPSIIEQVIEIRPDLILATDLIASESEFRNPIQHFENEGGRQIHPFELTPLAGMNILGVVCKKSNLHLRKQLLQFHDKSTAICSNVERRLAKELRHYTDTMSVNCVIDQQGRFQLAATAKIHGSLRRFQTIQSSWVGLHEAAMTFFQLP